MPRKPKEDTGEIHQTETEPRVNGMSAEQIMSFINRYESLDEEIDIINRNAREECQPHIDDQKEVIKEAAEAGLPKKVFKAKLKQRRKLLEAERCRSGLNEGQQATFDEMSVKLEKLAAELGPLGQAAYEEHQASAHS